MGGFIDRESTLLRWYLRTPWMGAWDYRCSQQAWLPHQNAWVFGMNTHQHGSVFCWCSWNRYPQSKSARVEHKGSLTSKSLFKHGPPQQETRSFVRGSSERKCLNRSTWTCPFGLQRGSNYLLRRWLGWVPRVSNHCAQHPTAITCLQ